MTNNTHIYVLRGDIQEIWEYGVYGVYTSKEEALKVAQHLINALSDSTRKLIPEYSYDQNKISSGLVISDLIINQTNIVNPSNFESTFFLTTLNGLKTWIRFTNHI